MAAEAAKRDDAEHGKARGGRDRDPRSLVPPRRREQQERQHESGCDLDANADDERRGAGAKARARASGQRERGGERQQDQRVVVRAADGEHEQHGIQSDERARPAARVSELPGGASDQRDRAEAAEHGQRLECPQRAADAERHRRVAEQREQRPVRRVLVGPAEEREDFVAGDLCRDVRVRVEPVQRAHSREADVTKHVLGEQRRAEQQDHVRGEDRDGDRVQRQRAREHEHEHVARAHDQRQRLKAARAEREVQRFERLRDPRRPAAAASRHVLRRFAGGAGRRQEHADDDAEQPEQPERTRQPRRPCVARPSCSRAVWATLRRGVSNRRFGQGRRLHRLIVTSTRGQASGRKGRIPSHARVTLATSSR
jgi:hypothetical protein